MTTISQCLNQAQQQLLTDTRRNAKLEAEILLAFVLHKPRSHLYAWPEHKVESRQFEQYQQLITRRQRGEPIAYITGQREFWGLNLWVSPATLIPRPETEHLVEFALQKIPHNQPWHIADLGTGSGAIALAIAYERPNCTITATDISNHALDIAKLNAQQLGLPNIRFIQGNWYEPLAHHKVDLIVANPPYIATNDPHLQQGDLPFEPAQALTSGADGLNDIRCIIAGAISHLRQDGWIFLEHGYNQGDAVTALLLDSGFHHVLCHQDYAQHERVSQGQWQPDHK